MPRRRTPPARSGRRSADPRGPDEPARRRLPGGRGRGTGRVARDLLGGCVRGAATIPGRARDPGRRAVPLIPRYRQKVRAVPFDLGPPVWVDDAGFDLGYHLSRTALPSPGGDTELAELIGRLMSARLDRGRRTLTRRVRRRLPPPHPTRPSQVTRTPAKRRKLSPSPAQRSVWSCGCPKRYAHRLACRFVAGRSPAWISRWR